MSRNIGYEDLVDSLTGLSITGVEQMYEAPPASVPTSDLPAAWPRLPSGSEAPIVRALEAWPAMSCDLVVALQPTGQSRITESFAATVKMLDNVTNALHTIKDTAGNRILSWTLTTEQIQVGEVQYWCVVATVNDGVV